MSSFLRQVKYLEEHSPNAERRTTLRISTQLRAKPRRKRFGSAFGPRPEIAAVACRRVLASAGHALLAYFVLELR